MTRSAAILGPACLFPLAAYLLARRLEGPLGSALEMLVVMMLGGLVAMVYVCVAMWRLRSQGRSASWFLGAGIALSPAVYFVVLNSFLRASPP
jgi:hypothetical protein